MLKAQHGRAEERAKRAQRKSGENREEPEYRLQRHSSWIKQERETGARRRRPGPHVSPSADGLRDRDSAF